MISIAASIADGATSALVAASAKWRALVSLAIVLGVIGSVLGNYLGIGVHTSLNVSSMPKNRRRLNGDLSVISVGNS
ncbi:DUF819 family protein [Siminovitchia thermophila]|uniref:DUF819 family protein n=1 Tax=Siminovitchia thermophila TaxID=1245522 RepID=UPI0011155817